MEKVLLFNSQSSKLTTSPPSADPAHSAIGICNALEYEILCCLEAFLLIAEAPVMLQVELLSAMSAVNQQLRTSLGGVVIFMD